MRNIDRDNVDLMAAGVAFWGLLALFPAIALLVSVYGLFTDPLTAGGHVDAMVFLPLEARALMLGQLDAITSASSASLGAGAVGALLLALWSASRGVRALARSIAIAYRETDRPDFVRGNLKALLFTVLVLAVGAVGLALIAGTLSRLSGLGYTDLAAGLSGVLPWLGLVLIYPLIIGLLYRHAPPRRPARWRWITPGALSATLGWVLSSLLFSVYVANFGRYNETYGSVGAVVVLLLWMWISAWLVIVGAEIDAELEHQTNEDSTIGPDRPMGQRGAWVADHEAPAQTR